MSLYSMPTLSSLDLIETFELYDKNKDGVIDETDISTMLNDLGQDSSPEKVKRIMEVADLDQDGYINFTEFTQHMQNSLLMKDQEAFENLKEIFKIFKQDRRGHIRAEDLRVCVTQMGEKFTQQEFDEFIKEFDSDEDGFISFTEFVRIMNS